MQTEIVQFDWKSFFTPDLISPSFLTLTPLLLLSAVRGLHPRQQRNHLVSRLSRLLPTQPELYMDNRDLSWQRLAQTLRRRMQQLAFTPRTMSFAPTEWPSHFAEQVVFERLEC